MASDSDEEAKEKPKGTESDLCGEAKETWKGNQSKSSPEEKESKKKETKEKTINVQIIYPNFKIKEQSLKL